MIFLNVKLHWLWALLWLHNFISHKSFFLLLPPDCYRLHLLMSYQKVCTSRHVGRQQSLDVRVWPYIVRSHCVVRLNLLLPACLSWRRTPFCIQLGSRDQLHPVATGKAAVQPDDVLLGRLRPQRWPFLTHPADDLLPRAASTHLATLFWQQRLACHELDRTCTYPRGNQEPSMWLLGPTGHLLKRAMNRHEMLLYLNKLSAFCHILFVPQIMFFLVLLLCFKIHNTHFSVLNSFQL